ncbi:MAG: hypothetical protein IJ356_02385 [Erysipelotrichaceae bacterium]|nr:hypothetical protein [Erysipelotrichaceae bacterium]
MKKILWIVLCIFSLVLCILTLYLSFTITGSGFLDLSNLAQYACYGTAALLALSAIVSLYFASKQQ